jgi:hypothetical protein
MLIQQPPAHHIGEWTTTWGLFAAQEAVLTYYEDGVRMGQLYDKTVRHAGGQISSQTLLWGPAGIAHLQRSEGTGPLLPLGADILRNHGPFMPQPEAKEMVDRLAEQADIVLAVNAHTACVDDRDTSELLAFFENFMWRGGKGKSAQPRRRYLPEGKKVWDWQGSRVDNDDEPL